MVSSAFPVLSVVLPVLTLAVSWVVAKVLKLPFWIVALGALLPLALPFVELPFESSFVARSPLLVIAGGWAVLLALAVGWAIARPLAGAALKGAGVLKLLYVALLVTALAVVALLVGNPQALEAYAPGWRGPAGMALLCASCLSLALSLARVMRAAVLCVVWAGISLVLASELFLGKLPTDIVRDDLKNLGAVSNGSSIDQTIEAVTKGLAASGGEKVRAFVMGDTTATGFPFGGERSLGGRLEAELENAGADVELTDLSSQGATIVHTRMLSERVAGLKPDLVIIAGWSADSRRGSNSFGIPGLSEREARAEVERRAKIRSYPLVEAVLDSRLYRYFAQSASDEKEMAGRAEQPRRVPPSEYETELRLAVDALAKGGATILLVPEAKPGEGESEYRTAMLKVAEGAGALVLPADEELSKAAEPLLFARGRLVSPEGYGLMARSALGMLRHDLNADGNNDSRATPRMRSVLTAFEPGSFAIDDPRFSGIVGEPVRFMVKPSEVNGDLVFKLRALEEGTRYYRVVFSVDGRYVADRRTDSREGIRVRFQLPDDVRDRPWVEVAIRTMASPPPDEDIVAGTQFSLPASVDVAVPTAAPLELSVGSRSFRTTNRFVATALDPRSGDIASIHRADDPESFSRWVHAQPWGTIVAGGFRRAAGDELSKSLRYLGHRGALPREGASVAVLGVCGVGGDGQNVLQSGADEIRVSRGSPILRAYERFLLEEGWVGDRPLFGSSPVQGS